MSKLRLLKVLLIIATGSAVLFARPVLAHEQSRNLFSNDIVPSFHANLMFNACSSGNDEGAQGQFISVANNNLNDNPSVPSGSTAPIDLELNFAVLVCDDGISGGAVNASRTRSSFGITNMTTNWGSINRPASPNNTVQVNWGNGTDQVWHTDDNHFQLIPGGALNASRWVDITAETVGINEISNGSRYECIGGSGSSGPPNSITDFNTCKASHSVTVTFRILISVSSSYDLRPDFSITSSTGTGLPLEGGCRVVRPSTQFRLNSRVRNNGSTSSPAFNHRVYAVASENSHTRINSTQIGYSGNNSGGGASESGLDSMLWNTSDNPALGAGAYGTQRYAEYGVGSDAVTTDGSRIYFEGWVSPNSASNSVAYSSQLCIIIRKDAVIPQAPSCQLRIIGNGSDVSSITYGTVFQVGIRGNNPNASSSTATNVHYTINGGSNITQINFSLPSGLSAWRNFPAYSNLAPGTYTIRGGFNTSAPALAIGSATCPARTLTVNPIPPTCSVEPVNVEINSPFRTISTITNGSGGNINSTNAVVQSASYNIPGVSSGSGTPVSGDSTITPAERDAQFQSPELSHPNVGNYTSTWTYTVSISGVGRTFNFSINCFNGSNRIARLPYFKVYGGEISAGANFGTSTAADACATTSPNVFPTGRIRGRTLGSGSSISGASAEFAIRAMEQVSEAYSSSQRPIGTNPQRRLTLSNTSGGTYGGNFDQVHCISNFWRGAATATPSPYSGSPAAVNLAANGAPAGINDGDIIYHNGDLNIGMTGLGVVIDKEVVLYVEGSVRITSDIRANEGVWTSPDEVKTIYIVVKGSLYIDPSVGRIDAVLITVPLTNGINDGDFGKVFTCRTGINPDPSAYPGVAACNRQLVINGALIGRQVRFGRNNGTIGSSTPGETANPNIAEIINFSPAVFVGSPLQQPITDGGYQSDSVSNLPPVF